MYLREPEEIQRLREIYEPYWKNGPELDQDAPTEAKVAFEKANEWFKRTMEDYEH